ncbi:hypothetical protein [Sphingobacterium arenae]|uniref:Uncharacterized protein n=1 Tax=Sphingobacterium arenae TaxID=1280598 RepID=A0ABR7XY45_9SPHI|nr:hypothetical protein [Sphingobacterium arenae]MBD1423952.1 hypothetical protein [Sphingobacterium arenae]
MVIPPEIANFISTLQKDLGIFFSREDFERAIVLQALTHDIALVIYFEENAARINMGERRTFHIDLDQILNDPYKIRARICSLLGRGQVIYGRQTIVARIDKGVALAFLKENHLQPAIPGKYRYGLFDKGELVSVAIFSGGRRMREQTTSNYRSFELIRFCHKAGYRVVGGLSKLLKAFIKDFHPNDIMTYVDRDWAQVSNLHTLGFEVQGNTSPQAFWIVDKERHHVTGVEHLVQLQQTYSTGYLSHNSGSTKLVLRL